MFFHILPFIEQANSYNATLQASDPHGSNVGPNNTPLPTYSPFWNFLQANIKTYVCPSDPSNAPQGWSSAGLSSYAYNAQAFPVYWNGYNRYPASISDGTSNSIFFTEQPANCVGWWGDWGASVADASWPQATGPAAMFIQFRTSGCPWTGGQQNAVPASAHTGGIMVGMGDGSVRLVAQGTNPTTWWSALTVNGGEVLGSDW